MPPLVGFAGSGFVYGVPVPAILVAVVTALLSVFTLKTLWGRCIYAVGGNPDVANSLGVPRDRVMMSAYVISGAMAGFAGLIYAGRTDAASPLAGPRPRWCSRSSTWPAAAPTWACSSPSRRSSSAFLACPIGAAVFGHIGDRLGRRVTMVMTLSLMGASTLLIGLLPTQAS